MFLRKMSNQWQKWRLADTWHLLKGAFLRLCESNRLNSFCTRYFNFLATRTCASQNFPPSHFWVIAGTKNFGQNGVDFVDRGGKWTGLLFTLTDNVTESNWNHIYGKTSSTYPTFTRLAPLMGEGEGAEYLAGLRNIFRFAGLSAVTVWASARWNSNRM